MAQDIGSIVQNLGNSLTSSSKWIGITVALILCLSGIVYWYFAKKRWNLRVEFKLIRGNGQAIFPEWGKGLYQPSKGICWIKREGMFGKKYPIQNFDPKVYLQGTDTLTVMQVSADQFMPVAPIGFSQVIDEHTGKDVLIMDLKADTSKNLAWAIDRKMALMDAFTIRSWLAENGQTIGFGLVLAVVIFGLFIGFGMVLDRLPAS